MSSIETDDGDQFVEEILIQFPAKPGYLSLCRVNAATVGSMLGFDLDELDDLRLAVNESVTWLLSGGGDSEQSRLELRLQGENGRLEFVAQRVGAGVTVPPMDDLIGAILGATVDEFTTEVAEDGITLSFSKSLS